MPGQEGRRFTAVVIVAGTRVFKYWQYAIVLLSGTVSQFASVIPGQLPTAIYMEPGYDSQRRDW
jgi:hypothetical protein